MLMATEFTKAGDETRTRNIQLGRLMLYQLSYARKVLPIENLRGIGMVR